VHSVERARHFDAPDLSREHAPRWSSRRRNGKRVSAEC
jgi:hypothetical protein